MSKYDKVRTTHAKILNSNVKIHLDIGVNCGSTSNVQKLNLEMSIYTVNTVLQASVPSM